MLLEVREQLPRCTWRARRVVSSRWTAPAFPCARQVPELDMPFVNSGIGRWRVAARACAHEPVRGRHGDVGRRGGGPPRVSFSCVPRTPCSSFENLKVCGRGPCERDASRTSGAVGGVPSRTVRLRVAVARPVGVRELHPADGEDRSAQHSCFVKTHEKRTASTKCSLSLILLVQPKERRERGAHYYRPRTLHGLRPACTQVLTH